MRTLRRLEKALFRGVLAASARAARTRGVGGLVPPVMRALAALVRASKPAHPGAATDVEALARTWQGFMPSARMVPITTITPDEVRAEIRPPCPLRGTGDLEACHRLMAYDRALLAPHGGRLVVLRSQAEPGVHVCEVAIRRLDQKPPSSQ